MGELVEGCSEPGLSSKMEDKAEKGGTLVFAVNGQRFELSSVDPSTTLLQFLRNKTCFKSVKLGCGEGGCGACVVLLSKYDPVLDQVEDYTVSSCLTLLCGINGCSITTSEGLGNSKDGFHPIQERIAGFHASQCGFCTPGMCMSLFGAIVNADKTDRSEPPSGFSKMTVSEAETAIAGNLCRCTGYRPIVDACKSFVAEVDMEDLGFNSFWGKGNSREARLRWLPLYESNKISTFPVFLKKECKPALFLASEKHSWHSFTTLEELQRFFEMNRSIGTRMKLVASNTSAGYYKDEEIYEKYIDVRHIPKLSKLKMDSTGIEIGATVTISKAIESLRGGCADGLISDDKMVFKKIGDYMEKIASGFIRNMATVGGNLVMAQRNGFPSDISMILQTVDAVVSIMVGSKFEKLTLEDFLQRPSLDSRSLLLSIKIPSWQSVKYASSEFKGRLLFETYRAAPRPLGNALPYMNAAFLAEVSPCNDLGRVMVDTCRLAYGSYGTKHAIRARRVEEFLEGKILSMSTLYEAVNILRTVVVPVDGTSRSAYRSSLAVGFLFEFFLPLVDSGEDISSGNMDGCKSWDVKDEHEPLHHNKTPTLLSSAKQILQLSTEYHPVGEPIANYGATLQASGEAVYVDDIPSPQNCLYGAFVYSTKPLARVKCIKIKPELQFDGVIAVITSQDIPKVGENIGSKTIFGEETLFADEITKWAGERLAFVVAKTQKTADMAAKSAVVDYDLENLEPPILSVEDAVKKSSFFDVHPIFYPKEVGDLSKGMAEADHKILSAEIKIGSQYYFYMETQTALATPDEDNCMVVYSSSQCPEYAHDTIAKCLGVPSHNVRVITRRVGGGFGGKAIKSMPVATACALAADKLGCPVRMYLDRRTDMIMAGGRHPMKITYNVGFKSDGKITALQLEILIDAGIAPDISPIMPLNVVNTLRMYNWGVLSFDIKVCRTNHSSKSAMRAPGEVQGAYIAEAVIENVAAALSMDVDSVRNINLHKFESLSLFYKDAGEPYEYTLLSIWNKLAVSARFEQRNEMVEEFNRVNKWKKRGISRVPVIHGVTQRPTPGKVSVLKDGSVVVEVGGIELGQGLWTKVKQMAAFALSLIQCDGVEHLMDKVRVVQADTLSLIQGGFTSGSTTSESSCEAVRLCCNILVDRLAPLNKTLQEQTGSVKWDTLIQQAYMKAVNMSASSYYSPDMNSMHYLNYGAAVSEVEVNILTGETTIIQTDLIYDCGQSLNPAVDLGQIEGAFVQGVGFVMLEEYLTNSDGLVLAEGTWQYKVPTIDTIPKNFNVEILNSGHHKNRVLSSKASGEPPLLLAISVHCAARAAVKEARRQLHSWSGLNGSDSNFQLGIPATLPAVKEAAGLDIVERYLEWRMGKQ